MPCLIITLRSRLPISYLSKQEDIMTHSWYFNFFFYNNQSTHQLAHIIIFKLSIDVIRKCFLIWPYLGNMVTSLLVCFVCFLNLLSIKRNSKFRFLIRMPTVAQLCVHKVNVLNACSCAAHKKNVQHNCFPLNDCMSCFLGRAANYRRYIYCDNIA